MASQPDIPAPLDERSSPPDANKRTGKHLEGSPSLPTKKRKPNPPPAAEVFSCTLCNVTAKDKTSFDRHINGKTHKRRAKATPSFPSTTILEADFAASTHKCFLCDVTCRSSDELQDHRGGQAHAKTMEIAERASQVFTEYLTSCLVSEWRPPFWAESNDNARADVEELLFDRRSGEWYDLVLGIREGIHRSHDEGHWSRFIDAVATGALVDYDRSGPWRGPRTSSSSSSSSPSPSSSSSSSSSYSSFVSRPSSHSSSTSPSSSSSSSANNKIRHDNHENRNDFYDYDHDDYDDYDDYH